MTKYVLRSKDRGFKPHKLQCGFQNIYLIVNNYKTDESY